MFFVDDCALLDLPVGLVQPLEVGGRLRAGLTCQVGHPRDEAVELAALTRRKLRLVCG